MPIFNHPFINMDQQNGLPSSSKVVIPDISKSYMTMPNDHLRSEIARRALAVVEAYEELGSACRRAEYAVSQLKAMLPPDANVVLPSDTPIPSLQSPLQNKPPQNFNLPIQYDENSNSNQNTAVNTVNTTSSDDTMVASLLMSLTNASWERNTSTVDNDKDPQDSIKNSSTTSNPGVVTSPFESYNLDDDDDDDNEDNEDNDDNDDNNVIYDQKNNSSSELDIDDSMMDNEEYPAESTNSINIEEEDDDDDEMSDVDNLNVITNIDNQPSEKNDHSSSNSENSRKRSSGNRNRTRRKSSTGRVSSPTSPYSTQFTPEETLFLDEFNKLYEKRVQMGPTRQSDIASEIRQFANNAIAFGQPAVSGLVRKTKVPKEQRAVNALKAWIESGKKRLDIN